MRARVNRAAQAFEDLAEPYDAWYDTESGRVLFDLELGALRPLLAGTAGPRLEVGVGSGRFAAALGLVPLDSAWGRSYEEKGRAGHAFHYRHARFQTLAEHRRMLATAGFRLVECRSTLLRTPSDEPLTEPVRRDAFAGAGFVALAAQREDAGAD